MAAGNRYAAAFAVFDSGTQWRPFIHSTAVVGINPLFLSLTHLQREMLALATSMLMVRTRRRRTRLEVACLYSLRDAGSLLNLVAESSVLTGG